jgi:hypothetical protein
MQRSSVDSLYDMADISHARLAQPRDPIHPSKMRNSSLPGAPAWSVWKWEAAACFMATVSLSAVVATLYPYNGQPLPQWPFRISINTLVSIFSVVLKASFALVVQSSIGQLQWQWLKSERPLYDLTRYSEAGQGGAKSVAYIWAHHFRQPLGSLAAFIAIMTIAVDPFFQQLVGYTDCQVPLENILATIPRTNYFDSANMYSSPHTIVPAVQDAIVGGFFTQADAIQADCSTGNCTFPMYSTAGYCSTCDDVSESLSFSYECPGDANNSTSASCGSRSNISTIVTSSLSSSLQNMTMQFRFDENDVTLPNLMTGGWAYRNPCQFDAIAGKTPFTLNNTNPSTGERPLDCEHPERNDWRCRGYGAARCRIYPCVRTYNTTIQAGTTSEIMTGCTTLDDLLSIPYWNPGSRHYGEVGHLRYFVLLNLSCVTTDEQQNLSRLGYDISQAWVGFNLTDGLRPGGFSTEETSFPGSMFARQCAYSWDGLVDYSLWNLFQESGFMAGNVTAAMEISRTPPTAKVIAFGGAEDLGVLYNSTNFSIQGIQDKFEDVASSFTAYIRTHGNDNYSEPAEGVVLHYATCLHINWPWISLPAGLLTGVLGLFYLTAFTPQKGVPLWKTSILPLVFRGPFAGVGTGVEMLDSEVPMGDSVHLMEKLARSVQVRLEDSGGETRLLEVKSGYDAVERELS